MIVLSSPSSVAFELFGIPVYWYGIIIAFAIGVGIFVADSFYRKCFIGKEDADSLVDFMPLLILVGVLCARLYYCALNYGYYVGHWSDILNIREGGLSIHGMLLGCLLFTVFYCKYRNINPLNFLASMAMALPLGQAIGRWGNFFNSEAFGLPCDGVVSLYIAPQFRPLGYEEFSYFHPTFLYESLLDFGIFIVLLLLLKKYKNPALLVSAYFFIYALVRILVESLRIDSVAFVFGLPFATVVSISILFVAFSGIILAQSQKIG